MNAASVTMTHTTMDLPVSRRFFPGLLPIIGDEAYEGSSRGMASSTRTRSFRRILNCGGTWSKGSFRALPFTRSSGRAANHKTTRWEESIERSISSSPAMSSR